MAYNSTTGSQMSGDIRYENDPEDTQIDFENDSITFKAGNSNNLVVAKTSITASVLLSSSMPISASAFYGDGAALTGVGAGTMSSFNLAGDGGAAQTISNANTLTVAGGTGLSSTAAATDTVTVNLDNTSVSAGDYTYSAITVDAQGRLTAASNGAAPSITTYSNAADNRIMTSVDSTSVQGEANLTFDGTTLAITGGVGIDKNHTGTGATTITGIEVDFDKTGTSTSNNTMYGVKVDMDNTTATNGANYMYGLHVTPTLTHAADAGDSLVFGAFINAQAGTNGTGIAQAARFEAGGGDLNFGIVLDCEDGGTDFRIESSADNGDYFQIQTTTHGATTITTVDDDATAAHLTFNVDGDITLDPAGGDVIVDGNLSASLGVTGSLLLSTGSTAQVAVGKKSPVNTNMLYVNTHGNDNRVPLLIVDTAEKILLAVTGSGKVVIGGSGAPYIDGMLNITGSENEKLITIKSDTKNPVFYVKGDGDTFVSGALMLQNTHPTMYFSNSAGTGLGEIGFNSSDNILVQNKTANKHIVFKTSDAGSLKEGFRIDGAVPEVVVNQGSDSLIDFRVESNGNTHMFFVDGSANKVGIDTNAPEVKLDINDNAIRIRNSSTPSSAGDFGVAGEIRWDANYIYVCIATDSWKRVAISTW